MAVPVIPNGETQFNPIIYSGNGVGQRVGKFIPFTPSGVISKSCIFNNYDTSNVGHYLQKASMSAGNQQVATFSAWIKWAGPVPNSGDTAPGYGSILEQGNGNWTSSSHYMFYMDRGRLDWYHNGTSIVRTNFRMMDTSKWYHVMWALDVRKSNASDRLKIYIDGNEQTSLGNDNRSSLSQNTNLTYLNASGQQLNIGSTPSGNGYQGSSCYMAEINYIDGQQLTPASFGETDTSTGRWVPATVTPYPTTTTTYTVTVVGGNPSNHPYHNVGSTNKFAIDGSTATADVTLNLVEGATYRFDQSDNSNSGHPLRFSTTANGTHGGGSEYTTGVTTNGTPGSSGAYTEITVASGAPTLYYYCTNHSAMGWTANTPAPYGTNGFRMQFGTDSALGDDTSGNNYDLAVNGITSADQRTDTPTNNLPIMRPYNISYSQLMYEGALTTNTNGSNKGYAMCSTIRPKGSGKYYAEVRTSGNGGGNTVAFGCYTQEDLAGVSSSGNVYVGHTGSNGCGSGLWYVHGGTNELRFGNTVTSNPSVTISGGDVIGIALDLDNDKISFYDNSGSLIGSTTFDSSKSACFTAMSNTSITFIWNFGDNGTFAGNETAGDNADEDGNGNFFHSVPTGFKMLRQQGVPETAKGLSDFVWVKNRDQGSNSHGLIDSSRGARKNVFSNSTSAEQDYDGRGLTKFLKGGYSCGDYQYINGANDRLVSWNWVANGGTTASSTNSTVQVNSTSKFSIVQYNGTGSDQTIGHGLGVKPDTIWVKCVTENSATGTGVSWRIWQKDVISLSGDANSYLRFDSDDSHTAGGDSWGDTPPTSSVFTVGADVHTNASVSGGTAQYIAYCFANVDGYSKTGKYVGNSSSDGSFIYLGFKPAFLMVKAYNLGSNFQIWDNVRSPNNPIVNTALFPDLTNAEGGTHTLDLLSNGFKLRSTENWVNSSSYTYVYWAFAEHPFVGDGTSPVTAR